MNSRAYHCFSRVSAVWRQSNQRGNVSRQRKSYFKSLRFWWTSSISWTQQSKCDPEGEGIRIHPWCQEDQPKVIEALEWNDNKETAIKEDIVAMEVDKVAEVREHLEVANSTLFSEGLHSFNMYYCIGVDLYARFYTNQSKWKGKICRGKSTRYLVWNRSSSVPLKCVS